MKPLVWEEKQLKILDQRKIPWTLEYLACSTSEEVEEAIRNLSVRGAPAIGAAAAFGLTLGASSLKFKSVSKENFIQMFREKARKMSEARPTAVNLSWAVNRMLKNLEENEGSPVEEIIKSLEKEALLIFEEDIRINQKIGELGASLISAGDKILTHCNAGALATAGYGTALGVVRKAHEQGKNVEVYVDETRPVLQGSRLTAWELKEEKIPFVLVTDNMAGLLMQKGLINLILVGADRITQNGDTANKIGTYALAVLANYHKVPFYVAAPTSTFDLSLEKGDDIPIEERNAEEVTCILDKRIAPENIKVFNPSFDVTPHYLINAIITEKGIIENPDRDKIRSII
ncbi:MAG: S-methyl-5-thioribose-1-phosphate isomerase [Firmicutes bacterium HGW-Firmicutes-13]|nr:MAG: S-methyl-5-thioribose-1-phosphate isomerase [Firmicutes bacterium HGW-Firmicutes-13]